MPTLSLCSSVHRGSSNATNATHRVHSTMFHGGHDLHCMSHTTVRLETALMPVIPLMCGQQIAELLRAIFIDWQDRVLFTWVRMAFSFLLAVPRDAIEQGVCNLVPRGHVSERDRKSNDGTGNGGCVFVLNVVTVCRVIEPVDLVLNDQRRPSAEQGDEQASEDLIHHHSAVQVSDGASSFRQEFERIECARHEALVAGEDDLR